MSERYSGRYYDNDRRLSHIAMKEVKLKFYSPAEKLPEDHQEVIILLKNENTLCAEYSARSLHPSSFSVANYGTIGHDEVGLSEILLWAAKPWAYDILSKG